MKSNRIILFCLTLLNSICHAHSEIQYGRLSLNASIGLLTGKANEYVYNDSVDTLLSELNWKIKEAVIIKGDVSYHLLRWLTANINGWTTLGQGKAVMDDYDWLNPLQSHWTHWSHSPNTQLNFANETDVNFKGWVIQHDHYRLGITSGYQNDQYSFLAHGGCYNYNNGNQVGCFPDNLAGIGYRQNFDTVYFGLVGQYSLENVELNTVLKYGPWVRSQDTDQHYFRNLTFSEEGFRSNFYSVAFSAGYDLTQTTKLVSEVSLSQFTNGIADTVIVDHNTGYHYFIPDSAGLSNKNLIASIGIKYTQ